MRSNIAVFMPWIDDADGQSRKRDLFELPAFAEIGGDRLGLAAVRIGVEQAAIFRGQKFARGQELLLRQQRRHQARERAAALMEFHRRCAPRREGAGRLAAGKAERLGHGLGVEPAQPADRRGSAERTENARPVPALGPGSRDNWSQGPTRVVTSHPAASATSRSRPDKPSRSAMAKAGGITSGVTCVSVERWMSHMVTAVTR